MPVQADRSYDSVAKTLHWLVAAVLVAQFTIGWLMPHVRRGEQPGTAMQVHISIGIVILALILIRFVWRVTHPVPAEPELPTWQRHASLTVHWLLYLFVAVNTLSGWLYVSARGWPVSFFGLFPIPLLVEQGSRTGRALGGLHENLVWVLLALIVVHVAAALVHLFVYRDQVMQRMLPRPRGQVK